MQIPISASRLLLVSLTFLALDSQISCVVIDEVLSLNVWLTVSSLASKDPNNKSNLQFRQVELNWINAPLNNEGDYIALYLDTEPDAAHAKPVSIHYPNTINGKLLVQDYYLPVIDFYNETFQSRAAANDALEVWTEREGDEALQSVNRRRPADSTFNDNHNWNHYRPYAVPDLGGRLNAASPATRGRRQDRAVDRFAEKQFALAEECLGYCVAYHSQRKMLAKSCLRTYPNWMQVSQIGSHPLTTLAIAGTHNSGTYLKQQPGSSRVDKSVLQLINKYQLNQEESIFNQLVYGIRYLDLRVGHSKVKHRPEELWIYHDIFRTDNSLLEVLQQIGRFLELAKSEIVIVDFHRFTVGFQNEEPQTELERHGKVLDLLYSTLGEYIVPSYLGQNAPLNEYVALNKRLFVGYAGRSRLLNLHAASEGPGALQSIQFGQYTGYQLATQPARDVDADKQEDGNNQTVPVAAQLSSNTRDDEEEDVHQELLDQRIGTRVYNRLKSVKLISHSFSRRSIEGAQEKRQSSAKDASDKQANVVRGGNVYKSNKHHSQVDRSMKVVSHSAPFSAASLAPPQSFNAKLSLLFSPVHHVWPNTDKEETLKQFIEKSTCRKYFGELNSLMAELTPTVFGAISDKYDGIRRLSSQTNRMVGDLIRSKFLHCINLVATDYFLGNDLIRLTIHANKMRQHHRNTDLEPLQSACKSFRHIKPLLDKSKSIDQNSMHSTTATATANPYQSDGISDLISSFFKRIFNRR